MFCRSSKHNSKCPIREDSPSRLFIHSNVQIAASTVRNVSYLLSRAYVIVSFMFQVIHSNRGLFPNIYPITTTYTPSPVDAQSRTGNESTLVAKNLVNGLIPLD